ncbi:hypothetical protein [Janthinobacterium agaricidamnosum]|uniref:hypothetical protein n=1 Tax=Janthinobacterium agaricidamnosum TaxID=55508 RepID=UPI00068F1FF0|nr:hypothetical protein [Janthinobacterium agaricidamnosum]
MCTAPEADAAGVAGGHLEARGADLELLSGLRRHAAHLPFAIGRLQQHLLGGTQVAQPPVASAIAVQRDMVAVGLRRGQFALAQQHCFAERQPGRHRRRIPGGGRMPQAPGLHQEKQQ